MSERGGDLGYGKKRRKRNDFLSRLRDEMMNVDLKRNGSVGHYGINVLIHAIMM